MPDLPARARGAIHRFADLMDRLGRAPTDRIGGLVETVITETGYAESLTGEQAEDRKENLGELVTLGANYDRLMAESPPEDARPPLEGFLEQVNLSSDQDGYDERADRVPIMTLHAAKGLEFPAVFIAGCEEGLLPHERREERPDEIEEERRLFFVGMTRAMQRLTVLFARYRKIRGRPEPRIPSRFLSELDPAAVRRESERTGTTPTRDAQGRPTYAQPGDQAPVRAERDARTGLAAGQIVRHPTYGLGRVEGFETQGGRRMVRIQFYQVGPKLLDPKYARLEPVASA
jgi:DNA helicase-2/ATP-dependent DNA helicase PcrA